MKLLCIFIGILYLIYFSVSKSCETKEKIMNCTGLQLIDCPPVNENVYTLILDNNLINNFSTKLCKSWTQLQVLSLKRNKLSQFVSSNTYQLLSELYLSNNLIDLFDIKESQLTYIDISHNRLTAVKTLNEKGLVHFYLNNNLISNVGLSNLIKDMVTFSKLKVLDISYNKFDHLPSTNLINLKPTNILSLNFSGNQLTKINLNSFSTLRQGSFNIDFSFNQITDISILEIVTIQKLNLSNNHLTKINGDQLKNIFNLQNIDISNNPLDCLCNESLSFIQWIVENKSKVTNQDKTICDNPSKPIFEVNCSNSSLTTNTPITTSTRHTTQTNTSTNAPLKNKSWIIVLVVVIISVLIISFIVWYRCRKNWDYQSLNESQSYSPTFSCDCLPMLSLRRQPQSESDILINHNDNIQYTFNEGHLNFDKTLNVICSNKDKSWVIKKIVSHLDIKKNIISSKMKTLDFANYTLIIVNGDRCLNDFTFIKNCQMAIESIDFLDIRLLIQEMPNYNDFEKKSSLIDFIKEKVKKKSYFSYDGNDNASCITNLKTWLNLDFVPFDV